MDTRNKKKERFLSLIVPVFVLIFLLTAGMSSDICTIFCVILISIMFFFQKPNEIISELFLYYPFYNLFKFGGTGISYYNVIIVVAILAILLRRLNRNIIKKISLIAIFCLYMAIVNIAQQNTPGIVTIIGEYLIPLSLVVVVFSNKNQISFKKVITYYSIGLIISSMCGLGIIPLNGISNYISPVYYRFGGIRLMRLQGLVGNPNYFSLDLNIAISCILVILLSEDKNKYNILLIIILAIFGIITLSKSFILALLISIILTLLFNVKNIKFSKFVLFFIPLIFLLLFFATESNYMTLLINRLSEGGGDIDSFTSSRSIIWIAYVQYIISNISVLLVGNGISSNYLIINSVTHAMHNTYIEIIYYTGIIGFIFLVFIIKNSGMVNRKKTPAQNYLPLIILCFRLFAINIFAREAFCICIILVGLALNWQNNKYVAHPNNKNHQLANPLIKRRKEL